MIFFNSSMPRSGSTLLQNIFNQNPDIYATSTDGSLELLFGARSNYTNSSEFKAQDSELMLKAWRGFCKGGLEGYCKGLTDKPNICIKSRGIGIHYTWYKNFMGTNPKIICMVRDMRGVFASMEKMFRENQEKHQDIQNHAQMTGTTTPKRIDVWVQSQPVGLAIERFQQMNLEGIDKNCLFVRMEDLAFTPTQEIDRVYEYLELPKYQHDFTNVEQTTMEDDAVYGLSPTLHKIKKKVEPIRPYYMQVLGSEVCDWINNRFAWYQKKFRYITK
jgi:sulfotransferase